MLHAESERHVPTWQMRCGGVDGSTLAMTMLLVRSPYFTQASVGHMVPECALTGQEYQGRAGGLSNTVSPVLLQQCSSATRLELTRAHKLHTALGCMLWVCSEVFGACTQAFRRNTARQRARYMVRFQHGATCNKASSTNRDLRSWENGPLEPPSCMHLS